MLSGLLDIWRRPVWQGPVAQMRAPVRLMQNNAIAVYVHYTCQGNWKQREEGMFTKIMVPLDLAEKEKWSKAIKVAADLARRYAARLTLVSVGGGINGKVSHSVKEYERLLANYAGQVAKAEGIEVESRVYDVPDPSVELDRTLIAAIGETGTDLVVMASHLPGWVEYLVNSHAGRVASHAQVSVFVVRD